MTLDGTGSDAPEVAVEESPSLADASANTEQTSAAASEASADLDGDADKEPESNKEKVGESKAEGKLRIQTLVDSKYGGDWDKFTDGLYSQWNSSSELHSELKEIKAALEEQKQALVTKAAPEPPLNDDPDFQALESEITALDNDVKANEQVRAGLITQFNGISEKIAELRGQYALADDFNKRDIERRVEALTDKQALLGEKWDRTQKEDKSIERDKKALKGQLKQLEKQISESRAQDKQKQAESLEAQADFRLAFFGLIEEAAGQYGLSAEDAPKVKEHLKQTIKAEAVEYLHSHPELPDDFVQKRAAAYFDVHKLAKRAGFKELSQVKTPIVQKPGTTKAPGLGAVQKPVIKINSVREAREYAERKGVELANRKRG